MPTARVNAAIRANRPTHVVLYRDARSPGVVQTEWTQGVEAAESFAAWVRARSDTHVARHLLDRRHDHPPVMRYFVRVKD